MSAREFLFLENNQASAAQQSFNESSDSGVVPVVLSGDGSITASQPPNARGTLGLCPPRSDEVVPVVFDADVDSTAAARADLSVSSASESRTGLAEYAADTNCEVATSSELPESLRLLALVGTDDDPYKAGGPWSYAEKKGGRVFFITQNAEHSETGTVLLTSEQIEAAVGKKGMTRWAWILHDKDTYSAEDVKKLPHAVVGALKARHFHAAVKRKSFTSIATIARAFGVPPNAVEVKPESAFLDLVEYLTHEHPNEVKKGQHLYTDDEVHANFDWRPELEDHKLARSLKVGRGRDPDKAQQIFIAVSRGEMSLAEVRATEPEIYTAKGNLGHLQKLRGDFLAHQDAPEQVVNYYVFGPGGVGKDLLAKALARALAPEAEVPFFKLGGENVSWEGYDGEPIVIWEDMRVGDMIRVAKSRGMLFRILGPWRERTEAPIVNVKNSRTQLLNRVNIVTGPESYDKFLRGLAGEYESMQGGVRVKHEAENLAQGFRRFPVIIPVDEKEFSIFINLGVLNGTREYESFEKHEHMRQDLEQLRRRSRAIKDAAERDRAIETVESQTVAPIIAQHARLTGADVDPVDADLLIADFADAGTPVTGRAMNSTRQSQHLTAVVNDYLIVHQRLYPDDYGEPRLPQQLPAETESQYIQRLRSQTNSMVELETHQRQYAALQEAKFFELHPDQREKILSAFKNGQALSASESELESGELS